MPSVAFIADPFFDARQALFSCLGYNVIKIDGFQFPTLQSHEVPKHYSKRIAQAQLKFLEHQPFLRVAFATLITCGRRVLQIPSTAAEAKLMLELFSGRRHRVVTTVMMQSETKTLSRQIETIAQWRQVQASEIEKYLDADYYKNRLGGYLPLDWPQQIFIKSFQGDLGNLHGAPARIIQNMIQGIRS